MKRLAAIALLVLASTSAPGAAHAQSTLDLVQKLAEGPDFRVRVQAALQLGKIRGRTSRIALENALDDDNSSVRAAAAAALKVLKDPAALAALENHTGDASAAVRAQIKNSIDTLRLADNGASKGEGAAKTELIVQVGKIRSGASTTTGAMLEDVVRASKQKLGELPGVAVFDASAVLAPSRKDVPIVMLTGRLKQLEQSRVGGNVIYLASIEFVLHKMPGQTIKGVVSGSARASGSADEMADARAMADLRRSAIEAAVDSAVRRAPQALRAAAQ